VTGASIAGFFRVARTGFLAGPRSEEERKKKKREGYALATLNFHRWRPLYVLVRHPTILGLALTGLREGRGKRRGERKRERKRERMEDERPSTARGASWRPSSFLPERGKKKGKEEGKAKEATLPALFR